MGCPEKVNLTTPAGIHITVPCRFSSGHRARCVPDLKGIDVKKMPAAVDEGQGAA